MGLKAISIKLTDLANALCNRLLHRKCVPHYHEMQIPEEQ